MYMVEVISRLKEHSKISKEEIMEMWGELVNLVAEDDSILLDVKRANLLQDFLERIRKEYI
jgi:hypothetical protein